MRRRGVGVEREKGSSGSSEFRSIVEIGRRRESITVALSLCCFSSRQADEGCALPELERYCLPF